APDVSGWPRASGHQGVAGFIGSIGFIGFMGSIVVLAGMVNRFVHCDRERAFLPIPTKSIIPGSRLQIMLQNECVSHLCFATENLAEIRCKVALRTRGGAGTRGWLRRPSIDPGAARTRLRLRCGVTETHSTASRQADAASQSACSQGSANISRTR